MENENNRNYLDERRSAGEDNPPILNPENEIKSGPKKELLSSSSGAGALKSNSNEVLDTMKKKKSKDLTIPIILGIVLLMVVTVVAGFYLLKDNTPMIVKDSLHQQILNSSMIAMSDIESYSFEGDFNLDSNDLTRRNSEQGLSLAVEFDGQVDQSNQDNIKSSFNIRPEIDIFDKTYEERQGVLHYDFMSMAFCAGCEASYLDLSMKSFGKVGEETVYLKLNDFGLGVDNSMIGSKIASYKNKWYFLDMKELKKMSGSPMEEDFDSKEMLEKIKKLFKKYEMIKFQKDLGDTKIDGKEVYHYQVEIDSEAVMDFYVELLKTSPFLTAGLPKGELESFEEELAENREEILAVASEVLANVKTEVWIGKEDKMIYRIDLKGDYDEEDINRITNKSLGEARAKAQDAKIKSEIQQVAVDLIIYGDDNNGFEGYSLENSKINISDKSKINIKTSKDAYVVWSELVATTDKWCVDSNNNSGYILGDIEEIKCFGVNKKPQGEKRDYLNAESAENNIGDINSELSFSMSIAMSDFNQPINISRPEAAEDLIKVLEEMAMGLMGGAMMPSPDLSGDDSDQDGLSDEVEAFYGTDPNNPDTDGDGFSDGNEVSRGYDPLLPGEAKLDYDRLFKY